MQAYTASRRWVFTLLASMTMVVFVAGSAAASVGFVYALRQVDDGANQIYGYRVVPDGTMTPLPGFPVATGGNGATGTYSEHLVYKNGLLYVVNEGSATLSVFLVSTVTGALTPAPYSPILLSGDIACVAVNPVNNTVAVGSDLGLTTLVITAATATVGPGSPFATGLTARPFSCAFSRDGNYVYTGGNFDVATAAFSVAPTGVLTPLVGSPFDSGAQYPIAYATDNSGRLFVTNFGNGSGSDLRVMNTIAGVPAVTFGPVPSGLAGGIHGIISPAGYYLVADRTGNRVGVYQIAGSGAGTTLAAVSGSPFASGGTFTNVLAQSADGEVVIAANSTTRNLTVFRMSAGSGTLTPLNTQASNTIGATGLISGLAWAPQRMFGDLDGDGKADVLLRNKSTGQDIGWLMNGLTITNSAFMPTIADTNWEIRGRGDFDGDGKSDVILRNKSTGQNIGWLMNGLTVSMSAFLPTLADTNWEIRAIGDFDGDGKSDVILRNKGTGQDVGWLMNGLTITNSAFMPTIPDTNWEIVGSGDFNGDGKSDVILRNKVTGQNIGWLMNGLTVAASAFLPTLADTNWEIKGIGDFDGDGKADVILRHKVTGQDVGWLMNGLTITNSAFMPTVDPNWEIKGAADFNGDGKADVILRNKVTGQNIIWLMNGLTVSNSAFLPTVADTNWDMVGLGQ